MTFKQGIGLFVFILLMNFSAGAYPVHLMPDASTEDYQSYLEQNFSNELNDLRSGLIVAKDPETLSLLLGERNLKWLDHLNQFRPADNKLTFSKFKANGGYPPDKPLMYGPATIKEKWNEINAKLPKPLAEILLQGGKFSDQLPVDEKIYLEWGRKINILYSRAARWKGVKGFLNYYTQRARDDIRGYFFAKNTKDFESKIRDWSNVNKSDQNKFKEWLSLICFNNGMSIRDCEAQLEKAIQKNKVYSYYMDYLPRSERIFELLFRLRGARSDVNWTSKLPKEIHFPFTDPKSQEIRDFVKVNIEDEWQLSGVQLLINFKNRAATKIHFRPGITPHVDGLGGNNIYMDANKPLTEKGVHWVIRHEFGHVLGLPDCYIEFYDTRAKLMVNYQVYVEDLMCSRAGEIHPRHFEQLKANYYKN